MFENTTSPCSKVQAKIRRRDRHEVCGEITPNERCELAVHHFIAVLFYVARRIARIYH